MTWRDTTIGETPARVARISFSGELAYEINVPTAAGLALWEAVMAAGQGHGITPYGTEALHILRAEKGYPIIGQETDGTVTPDDLGLGWAVSKRKDFIGRRSQRRADLVRPDRRQLVALLPIDRDARIDEGAQVVAADGDLDRRPVPMLGHVTSGYWSGALGRSFALGLVTSGRDRIGSRVRTWADGRIVEAVIADAAVFDPENRRRDGDPDAPSASRLAVAPLAVAPEAIGTLARRTPLAGAELPTAIRELALDHHSDVRADPSDGSLMARLEAAAGVPFPLTANTFTTNPDGSRSAVWLGPDEWLVIATDRSIEQDLRAATADHGVVDVSGARTSIEITGANARGTLEHGCSIDLDRRAFGTGSAAQTIVGRCGVLLLCVSDAPTYRLLVRPSFARSLATWLADAQDD
jgi:sarcosine oxidase subunit alpha